VATELNSIVTEVVVDDSQALPGAQRVVAAMDSMAEAQERADAAGKKQAQGLGLLDQAIAKVTPAQESALRSLNRWSAAADPAVAAQQRLVRAETDLDRAVQQGLVGEQRKVQILDQLRQRYETTAVASSRFSASAGAGAERSRLFSAGMDAATRSLGGFAYQLGPAGVALASFGAGGLAAAAGIGVLVTVIGKAVSEAATLEREQGRIQALLRSTGFAAGQTLEDIEELVDAVERSSINSGTAVRNAAAALLTFRSVSGEAFGRTIRVAADLAEVMGTDVRAAAVQLGKALEDPERNLSQLNRSGISFSQSQIEVIKKLVDTGREAEALSLILGTIEGQLGGAAAGAARGLTGAFGRLGAAVGNFLELVGNTGPLQTFTELVERLVRGVDVISAGLFPNLEQQATRLSGNIAAKTAEIQAQLDYISKLRGSGLTAADPEVSSSQKILDRYKEEHAALLDQAAALEEIRRKRDDEKRAAEQAAAATAKQREEERAAGKAREEAEAAAKKAATERAAAQKQAQTDLVRLEEQVALAGLDGIAKIEAERDLALVKWQERLDKQLIGQADFERARLGEVERAEREIAAIREKEAEKERDKAKKAAEKAAEEQAKLLQEPFKNAIRGIQGAFTDMFEDVFSGGVDSFSDLAESAKRIMIRMAAEIASALVFQAVIQPVVGEALGTGGGGGTAGIAGLLSSGGNSFAQTTTVGGTTYSSVGSSIAGGASNVGSAASAGQTGLGLIGGTGAGAGIAGGVLGTVGAIGGGIAVGYGAGTMLGGAVGGNQGNANTGALVGAIAGATIGALLGPVGALVGGLLGGLLGGGVGGLFGPGPSVGPNASGNAAFNNGTFRFTGGAGDNGGQVGPIAAALNQVGTAVDQIMAGLGATVTGSTRGEVSLASNTSGITARVFGGNVGGVGAKSFGLSDVQGAQEFLTIGAISRAVEQGSVEGLSDTVATAIRNSARTVGIDLEQFLSDIDFATNLDQISEGLVEAADQLLRIENAAKAAILPVGQTIKEFEDRATALGLAEKGAEAVAAAIDNLLHFAENSDDLTQTEQVLAAITGRFAGLAQALEQFGVTAEQVAAAEQASIAKVREGFDDSISQAILAITDPMSAALEVFNREAERRVREAEALGADLVEVERLNALQRAQVIEQVTRQQLGGLQDFFNEITFGGLSGASPGASLEGVRATFQATAAQALAGDLTAQGRIQDLGQALLEQSRGFFASSQGFQTDLDLVRSVVGELVGVNDNGSASVVAAINTGAGETARLLSQMLNEMSLLRQQVAALASENARLNAELRLLTSAAA
jgi:hypothetical protein